MHISLTTNQLNNMIMETKDFRKIAKKCLNALQKLQMSVIFDQNISMHIDTGCYMESFSVCVFIGSHEVVAKRRLVQFDFSPWHSKKDIENKCNGCIALVNAHRS